MGFRNVLGGCCRVVGTVARAVPLMGHRNTRSPGTAHPAYSADAKKVLVSAPLVLRPTMMRQHLVRASKEDLQEVYNRQEAVTTHQLFMEFALGSHSPAPARRGVERTVEEPSTVQKAFICGFWTMLIDSLQSEGDLNAALTDFTAALKAAPAGLLATWPFMGSNSYITNAVSSQYSIPDFIWTAFQMQKLQQVLPFLEQLLLTATAIDPDTCPALSDTLSLLAEASTKPHLQQSQAAIIKLLNFWGLRELPVGGCVRHWRDDTSGFVLSVDLPHELSNLGYKGQFASGPVGELERPRPNRCSEAFAAVQRYIPAFSSALQEEPTSSTVTGGSPFNIEESPQYQASLAEAAAAVRTEEQAKAEATIIKLQSEIDAAKAKAQQASQAAAGQEKTTKRVLAKKIMMSNLAKSAKIDALLTLSKTRNDQFCIRAYCVKHTNVFHGDFNARMVEKRRKSLSQESVDADDGGSATQSTGLPDEDVYI